MVLEIDNKEVVQVREKESVQVIEKESPTIPCIEDLCKQTNNQPTFKQYIKSYIKERHELLMLILNYKNHPLGSKRRRQFYVYSSLIVNMFFQAWFTVIYAQNKNKITSSTKTQRNFYLLQLLITSLSLVIYLRITRLILIWTKSREDAKCLTLKRLITYPVLGFIVLISGFLTWQIVSYYNEVIGTVRVAWVLSQFISCEIGSWFWSFFYLPFMAFIQYKKLIKKQQEQSIQLSEDLASI